MKNKFTSLRTSPSFDVSEIEDFGEVSEDNRTYLQESLAYRPEFAEAILAAGVPINHQDDNGQTALQYAIARGMYEIARRILDKGADVQTLDKFGNDPLWTAVLNPRPDLDLIELLLAKGADPHRKNAAGRSSADMATTKKNQAMMSLFGA